MPLLHPRSPTPESPKWRTLFIHPTDSGSVPGTGQGAGDAGGSTHAILLTEHVV